MITRDAADRSVALSETQQVTRETGSLLSKKIWLPKLIYAAIPYFYLVSGLAALIATLYIGHWVWVLPHYILFSAACLHIGILIFRRRQRSKRDED